MSDQKSKQTGSHLDLTGRVEAALEKGSLTQAKREFTRNWRDGVPELPSRISEILVRVDLDAVKEVLKLAREHTEPQLKLRWENADKSGRLHVRMARGRKLRIGDLPAGLCATLTEIPQAVEIYRPKLLEIARDESHAVRYVAVELSRESSDTELAPVKVHEAIEQILAEAKPQLPDMGDR